MSHDPGTLELAAPFIVSAVLIVLGVLLAPLVAAHVKAHFEQGWTEPELKKTDNARLPGTHALAGVWVMDASVVPAILLGPIASLYILTKHHSKTLLFVYLGLLVVGLALIFRFLRKTDVLMYYTRGRKVGCFQITPVVAGGFVLNLASCLVAVLLIK